MKLYDKLEEIRQKPEHIRIRYVWAMVGISMAVVIGIWVLSLKTEKNRLFPDAPPSSDAYFETQSLEK